MNCRLCRSFAAGALLLCVFGHALVGAAAPAVAQGAEANDRGSTLSDLLAFADRHAPAIQVASRERGHAAAEMSGAAPLFRSNPTVDLAMGPRFGGSNPAALDFVASLGQPIDITGERGVRRTAASRYSERLDAELSAVRWEVRCDVISAYRGAVVAREQVAVAEELSQFADEMLSIAQRRLAAGDATVIDVRVAEIDMAQARQFHIAAEQSLRAARIHLAEITGWAIDAPPTVTGALEPVGAVASVPTLMQNAAQHHPQLEARRAVTTEAVARTQVADRARWPAPAIGVQVAREGSAGSPANYIVLGTVGLALPVWQSLQADRANARVDEDEARDAQSLALRALNSRIAVAHSEITSALDRLRLFSANVSPSLAESLALLRRGFDAGELPLATVALARERFLQSRLDVLRAFSDYHRAHAALEAAVGTQVPITPDVAIAGGAR